MKTNIMINVVNVTKSYKSKVLDNISFDIEEGGIICIAGRNGSGKSTLLRIIASILEPDSGEIRIDGTKINSKLAKKHLGYVAQKNSLFEELTVKDNIKFFTGVNGKLSMKYKFDEDILQKKIYQLSDGMRKRVNILVSLINNPDYLLMDEPTANLDLYYKKQISDIIMEYKRSGKTIVFTSHDVGEMFLCDKLYALKDGKFIFSGAPQTLGRNEFADKIYDMIK
ncbi:MAG: ABC transporter ATP-binding protein [Clostridiales bacterium]|jgi:ABC-2 type transport system ATP-binding protein|nr:ABC transporter ATP-binding protein [Clostridiales bacterium]